MRPHVFGLTLALALGPVTAASLAGCERASASASEAMPAIRLGMSPRDVRDRFDGGGEGTWQTKLAAKTAEDTVLEWVARDPAQARTSTARFEFHLGMLVAVRAHLREAAAAKMEATEKTVSVLEPSPQGGSDLTILSRDCPTHHEEAESVASRIARPRS